MLVSGYSVRYSILLFEMSEQVKRRHYPLSIVQTNSLLMTIDLGCVSDLGTPMFRISLRTLIAVV